MRQFEFEKGFFEHLPPYELKRYISAWVNKELRNLKVKANPFKKDSKKSRVKHFSKKIDLEKSYQNSTIQKDLEKFAKNYVDEELIALIKEGYKIRGWGFEGNVSPYIIELWIELE